jgi:hypothetical protein
MQMKAAWHDWKPLRQRYNLICEIAIYISTFQCVSVWVCMGGEGCLMDPRQTWLSLIRRLIMLNTLPQWQIGTLNEHRTVIPSYTKDGSGSKRLLTRALKLPRTLSCRAASRQIQHTEKISRMLQVNKESNTTSHRDSPISLLIFLISENAHSVKPCSWATDKSANASQNWIFSA